MGFRVRKSINIGKLFKVNFSKSGIGYSFGLPGARITKTANNRVRSTISVPKTGISYVQETKLSKNNIINKKHSLLFDVFMVCITCGLWVIWMIIRPKY